MKKFFAGLFILGLMATITAMAADFVWMEGEAPTEVNHEVGRSGWGRTEYLSGGNWLAATIGSEKLAEVPVEGILIKYAFQAPSAGKYELWNRIGFEFARTDFEWRLDANEWTTVKSTDLTTDLMELARWCEVAWIKLADVELTTGNHVFEVRLKAPEGDGNKKKLIRYTSDAICLYKGAWRPNGKHQPDAEWQTERDREAEKQIFQMPAPGPKGSRQEILLNGLWQIARYDEPGLVEDRTGPIPSVPAASELYWSAIEVPGNRDALRPEWKFNHRYLYRTRVDIPADYAGSRFLLDVVDASMLTTVFVNGKQVGFHGVPRTGFQMDISSALKPGQTNEIWVGIKDAYYALAPGGRYDNARLGFNAPHDDMTRNQGVTMSFDFPMKGHLENGILDDIRLIATGPAYSSDVFAIPSVEDMTLSLEVTVANPGTTPLEIEVANEVVPLEGGAAEKTFAAKTVTIPAGEEMVVKLSEPWANPKLWWPDSPQQYHVVTRLKSGDTVLDTKHTKFGFRQWTIDGTRFVLNGVPWQLRANLESAATPEESVALWKETGQNMYRLRFQYKWAGLTQNQALDFFDASGVPVRRTCSTFDGQHASYRLAMTVGKGDEKKKVSNAPLFENWRKQIAHRVRQQRNHPSVFVWELDNEIVYINARNSRNLDVVEPEFKKAADMVMEMDPSGRSVMVAGGRAFMDQSMPINGTHYEASEYRDYPDAAYGLTGWTETSSKQPWPMALDKPIFMSEEFFAQGKTPANLATVGGEECFLGRAASRPTIGLIAKMYSEGYRWQELGAFHYWFGRDSDLQYNAWQPVLALCREWNWTLPTGASIPRTIMLRNDTEYAEPIEFEWTFHVGGRQVASDRQSHDVAPGHGKTFQIALATPKVTERTEGELVLKCYRGGKEVWTEIKPLVIIDPNAARKPEIKADDLVVIDPKGSVKARLKARGIAFTEAKDLGSLPQDFTTLIVGSDAVDARSATSPEWQQLARSGKRILVLDQANPLHYHAVPADFEPTDFVGRFAFSENLTHPAFEGLEQKDFFTWSGDHVVYRNVYRKATTGARSLVQCDEELSCSALAESQVQEGLMVLSQMAIGDKLGSDPVATRLFDNLVNYTLDYELVRKTTAVVLPTGDLRFGLLNSIGLQFETEKDVLAALGNANNEIVIADASKANLETLGKSGDVVKAFTDRGGWLMLWNATPDGLDAFNGLVGVNHLMRPFRREKVSFPTLRDPLTSGMSQRDLTLYTGEKILSGKSVQYVANDVYTHVVDYDDIVPFMKGPGIEGNSQSIANGFTNTEAWKYIVYMPMKEDGSVTTFDWELPRKETILSVSIVPNTSYYRMRQFLLIPDGDESRAQTVDLEAYAKSEVIMQTFELEPMEASTLKFVPTAWDEEGSSKAIVGIDNLWLNVQRSDDFYAKVKPLVHPGAIMKYPRGKGGIILNQLQVLGREPVPVNAEKKGAVVSGILRNLQASFSAQREIVAGAGLKYTPVSFEGIANLYITSDKGWPGENDWAHLPLDRQKFLGVTYEIRDFKTSPLETAIALKGATNAKLPMEVKGINVGQKADALFFLHTWYPSNRLPKEDTNPVLFQYVVHYADGQSETIDVLYEQGTGNWKEKEPLGRRDAALAWAAPFGGNSDEQAALYQMQWVNPHQEKAIEAIDLQYEGGKASRHGAPILFAISAATAIE